MIIVSEHHINIDQVDYYLPNNRCSVIEYCQTEPDLFSIEKMRTIWKPGFLDPEFQYRFFSSSTARSNVNFARPTKGEAAEFARRIGTERAYCATEETASDMAVKVVKQILNRAPGLSKEIGLVIHYHSTLNQKLYSSTPGRLQHGRIEPRHESGNRRGSGCPRTFSPAPGPSLERGHQFHDRHGENSGHAGNSAGNVPKTAAASQSAPEESRTAPEPAAQKEQEGLTPCAI